MNADFWRGRRVFLTGHTGFKGSWLTLWLHALGARVTGYALAPPTQPSLFAEARVAEAVAASHLGDVRDSSALTAALKAADPEIVIHMAAQSLVRLSYSDPVATYATNVMGTVNLLEAVRGHPGVLAVVNVTSDKCYENREWPHAYRETDAMGGHDPYSSSKGAAELVAAAYHRSFFSSSGPLIGSGRAGNVIGGGDWAADRLVPDFFRALDAGKPLVLRSPNAIRPWQHVLEPLAGYLALAERLVRSGADFVGGWNFGPADEDVRSVGFIASHLASRAGGHVIVADQPQLHEAQVLRLDSGKARAQLQWSPRLRIGEALDMTIDWHRAWLAGRDMGRVTLDQISAYHTLDDARMSARFAIERTPLDGLSVVRRKPLTDERGTFARLFCDDEFSLFGFFTGIRQINQSRTHRRGTIRGLHFQHPPHAEAKLVTCLRGRIFDVAVDLRRNSPSFLKWHGEILSDDNFTSLQIPPGFAHGFQTLSDDCELLYLHSVRYRSEAEGALNALDPAIAIAWPLPVTGMSDRDRRHVAISPSFQGLEP